MGAEPDGYCVVAAESFKGGLDLTLGFVDLGQGAGYVLEERSDGTYGVTWLEKDSLGASVGLEVGGALHLGARSIGLQAALRTSQVGTFEVTDTAVFTDRRAVNRYVLTRAAHSLVRRLGHWGMRHARAGVAVLGRAIGHDPAKAKPEETSLRFGVRQISELTGTAGVLDGEATQATEGAVEVSRKANGDREFAVLLSAEGGVAAGLPGLGGALQGQLGGGVGQGFLASFTMNPRDEVTSLRVSLETGGTIDSGLMGGTVSRSQFFERLGGAVRSAEERRTVIEYELDTTAPDLARAARRFLAQAPRLAGPAGDRRGLREAGEALRDQALRRSTLNVQEYHDRRLTFGPEGRLRGVAAGGSFDASLEHTTSDLAQAHYWDRGSRGFRPRKSCPPGVR